MNELVSQVIGEITSVTLPMRTYINAIPIAKFMRYLHSPVALIYEMI